jgi:hypothetical protein
MLTAVDRTRDIAFNNEMIRRSRDGGDTRTVRGAYAALVEAWKQHNAFHGGAFQAQLEAVKREYSDFVKSDPVYQTLRQAIVHVVGRQLGILQTELYKALSMVPKEELQYALYFAADHGAIIRTKKGRTYSLSLPTPPNA